MTKLENISQKIKKEISQRLVTGDMALPTEKELCEKYSCSRQTIRKVLSDLKDENLISSRQGSGYRLTGLNPDAGRNHICLLFTRPDEYIYPSLIYDIEKSISSNADVPMSVSVFETRNDFYRERVILKELLQNPPLAILAECFSLMKNPNSDIYRNLEKKGCSVIFLYGAYRNMPGIPSVTEGTYDAAYSLVSSLHSSGCRRICGVFRNTNPQESAMLYGFLSALRDLDLPFDKEKYIIEGENNSDSDSDSASAILTLCKTSDAIIFGSDEYAYPYVKHLRDLKILNLSDKKVFSFDNSYLSQVNSFHLKSFSHPREPLASAIAERILAIIKGQPKISIVLPYQLF